MADTQAAKKEVKRVRVEVVKEGLTHAGKECKVADVIEVTDWQADWLKKKGTVKDAAAGKSTN
jgi:hypothetical protein